MTSDLSRFTATPPQVHAHLCGYLADDRYLMYQQRIGAAAVREAVTELRQAARELEEEGQEAGALGLLAAADLIDPDQGAGLWPSVLVRHFGTPHETPAWERSPFMASYGRCTARTMRGERAGVCDLPLDLIGRCAAEGEHLAEDV